VTATLHCLRGVGIFIVSLSVRLPFVLLPGGVYLYFGNSPTSNPRVVEEYLPMSFGKEKMRRVSRKRVKILRKVKEERRKIKGKLKLKGKYINATGQK
jgi:hypothetical protein